jgi:hypothetical protein
MRCRLIHDSYVVYVPRDESICTTSLLRIVYLRILLRQNRLGFILFMVTAIIISITYNYR